MQSNACSRFFVIGAISVVLLSGAAALVSTSVVGRLKLMKVKLSGEIPEIPFPLLLRWIRPGSPVNLHHLAGVPNVIDVSTGQLRWESTLEIVGGEVPGEMGGVLSTVGDLVFA